MIRMLSLILLLAAPALAQPPIYSWSDWKIPGVTPLHWLRVANDPVTEADAYIAAARQTQGEPPPIFIWRLQDRGLLDVSLSDFVRGHYGHERTAAWVSTLFGRIAAAGLKPPMLVLDEERGFSRWHSTVTRERFEAMLAEGLGNKLPAYARGITADDLFAPPGQWDRESIIQWNRYARDQLNDALRKAVVTPARAAFGQPAKGGHDLPVVNYDDLRVSETVYNYNGWPLRYDQSVAGWSSPVCYLHPEGQRYKGRDPVKGRYEDAIAHVKSARATSKQVAPWISHPGWGGPESERLWALLVRDLSMHSAVLLWWNPREYVADEGFERQRQIAIETFGSLGEAR